MEKNHIKKPAAGSAWILTFYNPPFKSLKIVTREGEFIAKGWDVSSTFFG